MNLAPPLASGPGSDRRWPETATRTLVYWHATHLNEDGGGYDIRTRTKKEARRWMAETGLPREAFGPIKKVTVPYDSTFDLFCSAIGGWISEDR